MGREIDLLARYPKTPRDVEKRGEEKSEEDRKIARRFGKEFFDGERRHGYGGFSYNKKYWGDVVQDFGKFYNLTGSCRILDVGCAKGFMIYDFSSLLPGAELAGVDISEYALSNALPEIGSRLACATASALPFPSKYFDLVVSINTIHNLERDECRVALQEIERVGKGYSFVTVDAFRTEEEKNRMDSWNLTAKTFMHVADWKLFFKEAGYTGDYFWFIP